MAHDVFISYSTKDKIIADAVTAKLEEGRIRAWIAPRDVPAGSNFAQSIIRAINTCKVFILVWSANSNASGHILNEINQAFDQGITIIPFRIQDVQPTDEMRYYFGRTHWLDAINPPLENHIATLRNAVLVNLGREPQSEETKGPASEKAKAEKAASRPTAARPAKLTRYLPFAIGGLAVLTLVVLLAAGVFKGSPPAAVPEAAPSPTAVIKATSTSVPTATARPTATAIPAWYEVALDTIQEDEPSYQIGFDSGDSVWPGQNAMTRAGKLILTGEQQDASADLPSIASHRFAVEFEFRVLEAVPLQSFCAFVAHDDKADPVSSERTLAAEFTGLGKARMWRSLPGGETIGLGGQSTFDLAESHTAMLIILGDQIAVFLDGRLAYTARDPAGSAVYQFQSLWARGAIVCEYDNYKLWDLGNVH